MAHNVDGTWDIVQSNEYRQCAVSAPVSRSGVRV